jgi:glycosyltransferase involved in cell wall biosynthesis
MDHTPTRIVVCGHDLKFLQPMLRRLDNANGYELRIVTHEGHFLKDHQKAEFALQWADVIFCEWALDNAVWFSHRKRPNQILIVRLHLQEVQARQRKDFIYATDWNKVDRLILITNYLYDWMRREFPQLATKSALVYNPIPARSTLNLPKPDDARYVLGFVGAVPARKRLDLAVAVLKQLRIYDQRYRLHIKGAMPQDFPWMRERKEEMAWYSETFHDLNELQHVGAIVFEPQGRDMARWYQRMGHILSLSDFEGSHQAVAEGMAAGCVPAIRDWEGAGRIYPAQYVAGTVDELASLIQTHTAIDEFERESAACRAYAISRFDELPVCDALLSIIDHELRRIRPQNIDSPRSNAWVRPTFLIVAYIPVGNRSGYRIRVEQEIQALSQMGCIVQLACLLPPAGADDGGKADLQHARAAHVQEFTALGAHVHLVEIEDIFQLHTSSESFPSTVEHLAEIASRGNVDVLHAEALYCARVASIVKANMPGLCLSIDWHGVVPEESRMGGANEIRVKSLETAEHELLVKADLNVFVSESMVNHYRNKYGVGKRPQVIVPCCVSDRRFVTPTDDLFNNCEPGSLVFVYAGSMADWQCGLEMIRLFASLHRYDNHCRSLLLVPTSDHEKVLHYAEKVGLPASAFNLKAVAHDEVPVQLATGHIGVLLRRYDAVNFVSSPTKFGEYLAAGLPVLMTDSIGDFSQLAESTGTGYVIPSKTLFDQDEIDSNPDLLRQIVAFAKRSSSIRTNTSRHCQAIAREQLHWEPAARKWIETYRRIAAKDKNANQL